ncbi:MAG TPA: NADH-ubiquinone oxidoreductase-F iron-sulfur binding region domain-containing protein [Burkholderiaceae bacterium]|nr:NADH-ubiquinone oxidoreductase-F iron-sulfur binding region domain-containing protein [Burkholderiaceae bacterium]
MIPIHRDLAAHSFYHLEQVALQGKACQGLACFLARQADPARWARAQQDPAPVFCLGQCYQAPASHGDTTAPYCEVHAEETVLLGNVIAGGVRHLAHYLAGGGGAGLRQALALGPQAVLQALDASGLRGRGGAGYPTGSKWRKVTQQAAPKKYVVANADEGDPGAFSDRMLMEADPFRLIEAMLIAGLTVGATHGIIYLRKEYDGAATVLREALAQAYLAGWLGQRAAGSAHCFDLELVVGQGSYLCGEETAMLNAIEGRRPEARLRPPQITDRGLEGVPTLVNNVETLCAIPWILKHGAARYAALGTADSPGTKLLSLNSLFRRPGLYEVEFGISLRTIVEMLGQGVQRGRLTGVMVGGPLAGLLPPSLLDTQLDYVAMAAAGGAVGHGGVLAVTDATPIAALVAHVLRFGALESCGKCTPCHLGSPELARMAAQAAAGRRGDGQRWRALVEALAATSLCGHGRGLAEFAQSIARHYPEELASCFI